MRYAYVVIPAYKRCTDT